MPRANPERRDQLADAAIEVLARVGARGLTHRAVDAAAGVPAGTTSRYFRTREALLRGVVDRSLDSLTGGLARPAPLASTGVGAVADAVAWAVTESVTARRARSAAIFELFLEGRRRSELGQRLNQAREALLDLLRRIARAAGVDLTDEQAVQLLTLATGTVLVTLTAPVPDPADELFGQQVETVVRGAVTALLRPA